MEEVEGYPKTMGEMMLQIQQQMVVVLRQLPWLQQFPVPVAIMPSQLKGRQKDSSDMKVTMILKPKCPPAIKGTRTVYEGF